MYAKPGACILFNYYPPWTTVTLVYVMKLQIFYKCYLGHICHNAVSLVTLLT